MMVGGFGKSDVRKFVIDYMLFGKAVEVAEMVVDRRFRCGSDYYLFGVK